MKNNLYKGNLAVMKISWSYSLLIVLFVLLAAKTAYTQTPVLLHKNMVIKNSISVKKRTYLFTGADSISASPIIIDGDNITIDFNNATITGTSALNSPDQFKGTAIIVRGGKNITIKNLNVRGFKVGIMARRIKGLKIINCDFSYNYRQHLNSSREHEDLADWQSYHHNEKDEWLRFGAGIYLRDCDSTNVHDNKIIEGQCGLLMTNCNNGLIYNNNFSFNSGLGIGMYRSSNNQVLYNKIDWNVRGYSYGVYYRGQDSAGILVFEQCDNNIFAWNSVTHSGDGFFLWAGQSTMNTGEGGCNDNIVLGNDFSYAPTNGVEITFSRNKIISNRIHDCWHGVWGGFSYNTTIANNDFANNLSAIAIEHGMDNIIAQNSFSGDKVGIELWSNPQRPQDIGYLQKRDTRSLNYKIENNSFSGLKNLFNINNTEDISIRNNRIRSSILQQKLDSTVKNIQFENTGDMVKISTDSSYFPKIGATVKGRNAMLATDHPQGKKYIMMTEWGPYSFNYPVAWRDKIDSTGQVSLDMIGPKGTWKIVNMRGISAPSATSGIFPGRLILKKDNSTLTDIDVEFEYRGQMVTDQFGTVYQKDRPFKFHYREFDLLYNWQTKWFTFNNSSDPIKKPDEFKKLINGTPLKTTEGKDIEAVFGKGFGKGIPREKIATVSTSNVDLPEGVYRVGISASEMVRLYIDEKLVIENWDPAKLVYDADYHSDAIVPLKGKHRIRIEQAQYGDYGMLNLVIKPVYKN